MKNGNRVESSIKVILYLIFAVSIITGMNVLIGGGLSLPEVSGV